MIVPAFPLGVAMAGVMMVAVAVLAPSLPTRRGAGPPSLHWRRRHGLRYALQQDPAGGLATLLQWDLDAPRLDFMGAFPPSAFTTDANLLSLAAAVWAILAWSLGAALGLFNVTITFPNVVASSKSSTGAVAPNH
jgi:hypothetical protein